MTISGDMHSFLADVTQTAYGSLLESPVAAIVKDHGKILDGGKMLRARLVFRVGKATDAKSAALLCAAAAVEMMHAGSLLQDDVIDGGQMRRGLPSFWIEHGVRGAILLGDLLFFRALSLLDLPDDPHLLPALVRLAGEVCDAESEQELLLRSSAASWERCLAVARRKTGALFAFAGLAAAGSDPGLQAALEESGYDLGTAYQIADDILDVTGSPAAAGKTLHRDASAGTITTISAPPPDGVDAVEFVRRLCARAEERLAAWPDARSAWHGFSEQEIEPVLQRHLASVPAP